MNPAAVLAVVVQAQGVIETNAKLASVQKTLEKTDSTVTKVGNSMVSSGKKMQSAGKKMTMSMTLPLLGVGYLAVKTAAKFEKSMAQVRVAGEVGGKGMVRLEKLALKMGAETIFSANDSAEAMLELVKTGISPAQVEAGALASTMNLAATEGLALGKTAEIVGAAMNTFKIPAKESKMITDALAGGAIASSASVEGLSLSLAQAGQSAAMYGLTVNEAVGALAAFAQNGIQASDAGTSFKTFVMRLNPTQKKQKKLMDELNLSFFNQAGHLVNLVSVSKKLRGALGEMSQQERNAALQVLFGSDAQRAANIVYREGPKGIAKYIRATEKRGSAEKMANAQMKGMPGAIERMKGSLETAALVLGKALAPVVVKVAGFVEGLANGFAELDPKTQTIIVVVGGVVAALGPLVFVLGAVVRNGGYVVKAVQTMIGWFSKSTVATGEQVAANEALAASYGTAAVAAQESAAVQAAALQEVTAAQKVAAAERAAQLPVGGLKGQMTMDAMMPAAKEGAQMSLFAQPVKQAAAKVGPTAEAAATPGILRAGKNLVSKFGGAIGFNMPTMIAGLGLANILQSAMAGDVEGAGEKAGGALAGGIAGFFIGGPAGAMIGAGIGSAVGPPVIGAIKDLFGSGGPAETQLEQSTRGLAHTIGRNLGHLQQSLTTFHGTTKNLHQSRKAAVSASNALDRAESKLDAARKTRKGAHVVAKAEARVRLAKLGVERANRKVTAVEQLQGEARNRSMQFIRATVQLDKQRIKSSKNMTDQFYKELQVAQENGASGKRIHHILKEITRSESVHAKTKRNLIAMYKKANAISPEFGKAMKKIKTVAEETAAKERQLGEETKGLKLAPNSLQTAIQAWKKNQRNTEGASQAVRKATEKYGPFKSQSHQALKQATVDTKSWEEAGKKGITKYANQMNSFASQLGIANVHFGVSKKAGKKTKRQKGGMVVPGAGTGDKVPLTAMVEPGEVVHVLNMRAAKDVHKLGALEALNKKVPRRQEGGLVGGGATAAAMAEAQSINKKEYPYVWGGGHDSFSGPYDCSGAVSAVLHAAGLLERPMVSGELANWGAPGPGPITIFANPEHTFMSIMGKYFGTSGSNPGGGAGWFPAPDAAYKAGFAVRHPTGVGMMQLAKQIFEGPAGQLQKAGQNSMDFLQKAGSQWLVKNGPGKFGGGDASVEALGPGKIVGASTYRPDAVTGTVGAAGESLIGKMAFAELGMGTLLGGLPFHAKLKISRNGKSVIGEKLDIGAGGDDVQGHTRAIDLWYETANALGLPSDWLGLVTVQDVKKAQDGGLIGFQAGGSGAKGKDGKTKKVDPIAKSIKNVLKGLQKGKHLPKYHGALKKLGRHINDIGLNEKQAKRLARLGSLTDKANEFATFAENASTLTERIETGEGGEEIIPGMFQGETEIGWLNKQLHTLMALRRGLIGEYHAEKPQIPHLTHLIHNNKDRLHNVQKKIRKLEKRKREFEKQIKEIERAAQANKQKLEKEVRDLEHDIAVARRNMPPNDKAHKAAHRKAEEHIDDLERRKEVKSKAVDGSDKQPNHEIRKLNRRIHHVEKNVRGKKRVEDALKNTIIPGLEGRRTSIHELLGGLLGEGAEAKGATFSGLEQVQGPGGTMGELPTPPPIESVGGALFNVLHTMKELEAAKPKVSPSAEYTAMQFAELGLAEAELSGDEGAIRAAKEKILQVAEEDYARAKLTPSPEDDIAAIQEIQAAKAALEGNDPGAEALKALAEEKAQIAEEMAIEAKKREVIAGRQLAVFEGFKDVNAVAGPVLPYAGAFASGGVMMAEVGERGREVIAAPQGSRVVSSPEVKAAISNGAKSGSNINFEEVNFHEAENRVRGRANGQNFDQKVEKVNRKQTRKSMTRTPGGQKLR